VVTHITALCVAALQSSRTGWETGMELPDSVSGLDPYFVSLVTNLGLPGGVTRD